MKIVPHPCSKWRWKGAHRLAAKFCRYVANYEMLPYFHLYFTLCSKKNCTLRKQHTKLFPFLAWVASLFIYSYISVVPGVSFCSFKSSEKLNLPSVCYIHSPPRTICQKYIPTLAVYTKEKYGYHNN